MRIRNAILTGLALLAVLPACDPDSSRDSSPDADNAAGDEPGIDVVAVLSELQEVYAELRPIQDRAFESPDVLAAQRRLQRRVTEAVLSERPDLAEDLRRVEALQVEAAQAFEQGDTARAGELSAAAHQVQAALWEMEMQTLRRPEVRRELERFEISVRDRMAAQGQEAERLLARAEALEAQLEAAFPTDPETRR